MSENSLADYLDHMRQAAADARGFLEGMTKEEFFDDKRTQRAVVMSLIIVGEVAAKTMDRHREFVDPTPRDPLAQHARDAKPHCAWLFRHRPGCGLGDSANRFAGVDETTRGARRQLSR
jgi:uncharacterized protein with HEPN domain